VRIADGAGGFPPNVLDDGGQLGARIQSVGDLDGDGVVDVAAHAIFDDDSASSNGAMYVLFLNANGTAKDYQKISATQGGADIESHSFHYFGTPGLLLQPLGDQG